VIGAGTGTDTDKASLDFFSQAMFLLVAKQLGLDLDIANKNTHPETNTPSATK
jgi:hypothetical protein